MATALELPIAEDLVIEYQRRGFSARWVGDDVRFIERPGRTSPPFPDIDLADGDRLRNDWFPVIWSTP